MPTTIEGRSRSKRTHVHRRLVKRPRQPSLPRVNERGVPRACMKDVLKQKITRPGSRPQDEPKWRRKNTKLTIRPTIDEGTWKELRSQSALVHIANGSCETYRYLGPDRVEGIYMIQTGSTFFFSNTRNQFSWTTFADPRHEVDGPSRPLAAPPPSSYQLPELSLEPHIRTETAKAADNTGWTVLVRDYKQRETERWRTWAASSQSSDSDTKSEASTESCTTPNAPPQVTGFSAGGSISPAAGHTGKDSSRSTARRSRSSARKNRHNPFAGNNNGRLGREIAFAMVAAGGKTAAPAPTPLPQVGSPAKAQKQSALVDRSETDMMICEDKISSTAHAAARQANDDIAQYLFDTDEETACGVDLEVSRLAEIEGSGTSAVVTSALGAPAAKRNKPDVLLEQAKAITANRRWK